MTLPLWAIARWKSPFAAGMTRRVQTLTAPTDSPKTVTRSGSPPKPATGLAMTCPDLDAPEGLLRDLDDVVRLPEPHVDWPF